MEVPFLKLCLSSYLGIYILHTHISSIFFVFNSLKKKKKKKKKKVEIINCSHCLGPFGWDVLSAAAGWELWLYSNRLPIYPFCHIQKWGKDVKGSYGISGKMVTVF